MLFGGDPPSGSDTWEYGTRQVAARFSPFGSNCGPTLAAITRPIIGTTFTMTTSNLPSTTTIALMSAGASDKWILGIPLPLSLNFLGVKVYFQSAAGSVASNGGAVLFGNR